MCYQNLYYLHKDNSKDEDNSVLVNNISHNDKNNKGKDTIPKVVENNDNLFHISMSRIHYVETAKTNINLYVQNGYMIRKYCIQI